MKTLSLSKFFLGCALLASSCKNRHTIQNCLCWAIRLLSRSHQGAHHQAFQYLSQDSTVVTNDSLANGIYIADFFFTSCPSICPRVMKQMLRLHDEFKNVKG